MWRECIQCNQVILGPSHKDIDKKLVHHMRKECLGKWMKINKKR